MAYGPSFKQQIEVGPFDNIEVYNLMAGNCSIPLLPCLLELAYSVDMSLAFCCCKFGCAYPRGRRYTIKGDLRPGSKTLP